MKSAVAVCIGPVRRKRRNCGKKEADDSQPAAGGQGAKQASPPAGHRPERGAVTVETGRRCGVRRQCAVRGRLARRARASGTDEGSVCPFRRFPPRDVLMGLIAGYKLGLPADWPAVLVISSREDAGLAGRLCHAATSPSEGWLRLARKTDSVSHQEPSMSSRISTARYSIALMRSATRSSAARSRRSLIVASWQPLIRWLQAR